VLTLLQQVADAAASDPSSPPDRRAEPPPVLETDTTKSELADAKQTIVALKQQVLTLLQQVDQQTSSTVDAAASSDASSSPDHRAEPPAMPHALMLALRGLDDMRLRREFDKHADKTGPSCGGNLQTSAVARMAAFCITGTSRYNSENYCDATITFAKGKSPGTCSVRVCYQVHGDGSLGPLQDPATSSLLLNKKRLALVKTSKIEESTNRIKGTLEYEACLSLGTRIDFSFGIEGYSTFGDVVSSLEEAEGERRMNKAGLASFMRHKGLAHGDAEVGRAMERVDANKDGEIDFGEFRALARANSELEKVLQAKHLEGILCYYFPKGTTLEDLGKMGRAQFSAIVKLSQPSMVQLLEDLAKQMAAVGEAQDAAGVGKFTGELEGGLLDVFYKGVTGVCGEPDADIEKGMREEHTERSDSHEKFSTSNYGITTTPLEEWKLVFEGGSGCDEVEGKEGSVLVTSTRGCCKASGLKWLNTGKTDPTTLGLKWLAVGVTRPTEGRQLSLNVDIRLTDVFKQLCLASKTASVVGPGEIDFAWAEFSARDKAVAGMGVVLCAPEKADADIENNDQLGGKMAAVYRGEYSFQKKTERLIAAGAHGVIIINTEDDLFEASADIQGYSAAIPVVMIKAKDATALFASGNSSCLGKPTVTNEEQPLTKKVIDFTKEDLDSFGVTDLRSTDFIEAGGSYFKPTASTAQLLENTGLADVLMRKTEFTQQEWDAFGVHDLHMHHFVKSGDSYFHPAGEEQPDVRVLRPLAHYGDFGEDGRVKWGVDDVVVVGEAFTCAVEDRGGEERERELAKETKGTVLRFNEEGAAEISFREVETGKEGKEEERTRWVPKDQFYRLFPLPNARDTPIQRRVKQARLRRCE
jgi:hypothetical protein